MNQKKSVMGQVISVFVMVLIISILAGLSFLFVAQLKSQSLATSTRTSLTSTNESATINQTGYLLGSNYLGFSGLSITNVFNGTNGITITSGNYTVTNNLITNASAVVWNAVNISYTGNYISGENDNAYLAINGTESSGFGVVGYLPLVFLALIFGAILTLVLRIILPYVNLGNSMGGGF